MSYLAIVNAGRHPMTDHKLSIVCYKVPTGVDETEIKNGVSDPSRFQHQVIYGDLDDTVAKSCVQSYLEHRHISQNIVQKDKNKEIHFQHVFAYYTDSHQTIEEEEQFIDFLKEVRSHCLGRSLMMHPVSFDRIPEFRRPYAQFYDI